MELTPAESSRLLSALWSWFEAQEGAQDDISQHALKNMLCAFDAWTALAAQGVVSDKAELGPLRQHLPHPDNELLSEHSEPECKQLKRCEWYHQDVSCGCRVLDGGLDDVQVNHNEEDERRIRLHGTTLAAAKGMLQMGGFVPGENGLGFRGR